MISSEVEMHRHNINNAEMDEDDQIYDGGSRGIAKRDNDQPKRSPIRRKTKMRKEEERIKPKAKRNHKREKHRIKHEW
jgi:hypothetical protein